MICACDRSLYAQRRDEVRDRYRQQDRFDHLLVVDIRHRANDVHGLRLAADFIHVYLVASCSGSQRYNDQGKCQRPMTSRNN